MYCHFLREITRVLSATSISHCSYDTTQRQLDARVRVAGLAPKGDISTGMLVPAEIFPVSSKACL